MSTRYDPHGHAYDDHAGNHAGFLYVLMLVVALAFGAFVWQLYSAPEAPRIAADPGPYRVAPTVEASTAPDEGERGSIAEIPPAAPLADQVSAEASDAEVPPAAGPPQLAADPRFVSNGPYVAQLAALQSEAAVEQSWRRMSSRAPQLFGPARLDVERADLGARGVYYRVRAGYFADRANAARFCERIRQMGQDCIVAAR